MPRRLRMRAAPHLSASILNADFSRLGDEVERATTGGVDSIHLDVMDGQFVDNLTFGPVVVEAVRPHSALPFHSHLMISRPLAYAERFAQAGSDLIVFHVEADDEPRAVIAEIERAGKRPGIALNPETPAEAVLPWLDQRRPVAGHDRPPRMGRTGVPPRGRPEAARAPRRGRPARPRTSDRRRRGREPRHHRRRRRRAGETCSWSAAPCTVPPATWRLRSPPCAPPRGSGRLRDRSARRKDLTLLPRRSLWLGLLVLSLVGLLAACGENGPDLPFVPTPEPTPEQPREVAVSVVDPRQRGAHRGRSAGGRRNDVS